MSTQDSSGAAGRETAPEGKDPDGPGPGGAAADTTLYMRGVSNQGGGGGGGAGGGGDGGGGKRAKKQEGKEGGPPDLYEDEQANGANPSVRLRTIDGTVLGSFESRFAHDEYMSVAQAWLSCPFPEDFVFYCGANLALDPRNALRSLLVGMRRGDLGKQLRAPVSSKLRQSIADFAGIAYSAKALKSFRDATRLSGSVHVAAQTLSKKAGVPATSTYELVVGLEENPIRFYVSPGSGDDDAGDGSEGSPFKTVDKAGSMLCGEHKTATRQLREGSTVICVTCDEEECPMVTCVCNGCTGRFCLDHGEGRGLIAGHQYSGQIFTFDPHFDAECGDLFEDGAIGKCSERNCQAGFCSEHRDYKGGECFDCNEEARCHCENGPGYSEIDFKRILCPAHSHTCYQMYRSEYEPTRKRQCGQTYGPCCFDAHECGRAWGDNHWEKAADTPDEDDEEDEEDCNYFGHGGECHQM